MPATPPNDPDTTHPALLPGVSVEDHPRHYGLDRLVFGVAGLLIIAFVTWGVTAPDQVSKVSGAALTWTMLNLGWVFNTLAMVLALFLLAIAFSGYGRIRLGQDDDEPVYKTATWVAMLFSAGVGIGVIFFGPYEPMSYFLSPRPGAAEPATTEALHQALAQSSLHWGVHAWAFYGLVGLAVAYSSYRRGRVPLMSSIFAPFFRSPADQTPVGRVIDMLAIVATLFGTAASLGIAARQIGHGLHRTAGVSEGRTLSVMIVAVLTVGTIASAVSGVAKGIRWLSNINLVLALLLAIAIFLVGPTVFLLNIAPAVVMTYLGSIPDMMSASMSDGEDTQAFLSTWTTFYWAWWVSWAPFVGIFTAKISRGRTIRQFVLGVLLLPSAVIIAAFTILGGTAMHQQATSQSIAPDGTVDSLPAPQSIFFTMLDQLPGAGVIAPVVMVMLAIFFITSADSASLVNSQMSQRGNPMPTRWVTAFWALCMAGIAIVMLSIGGEDALTGLQNLVTVTALPFAVIMVGMCVALVRDLQSDPLIIRGRYEEWALRNSVRRGIEEHGDDFMLSVEPTTEATARYATGADFDTDNREYSDWYHEARSHGEDTDSPTEDSSRP